MNKLEMIILVGNPGSGKSTLALSYPDYVVINQDKIGNRNTCIDMVKKRLSLGQSILIDRCNITKKQRKYFIDIAKEAGNVSISCIYLDVSKETCIARILSRKTHETLPAASGEAKITEVVQKFVNSLERPENDEGYDTIHTIYYNDTDTPATLTEFCKKREVLR